MGFVLQDARMVTAAGRPSDGWGLAAGACSGVLAGGCGCRRADPHGDVGVRASTLRVAPLGRKTVGISAERERDCV